MGNLRRCSTLVLRLRKLHLYAVDAVHTVDEQNEDEDKGDLQPILKLCYYGAFGDEGKEITLHVERQRYDEGHEDRHLEDEEGKDLHILKLASCSLFRKEVVFDRSVDEARHICVCAL